MNFLFACPKCDKTALAVVEATDTEYRCMHCDAAYSIPANALTQQESGVGIKRCVVCPQP